MEFTHKDAATPLLSSTDAQLVQQRNAGLGNVGTLNFELFCSCRHISSHFAHVFRSVTHWCGGLTVESSNVDFTEGQLLRFSVS